MIRRIHRDFVTRTHRILCPPGGGLIYYYGQICALYTAVVKTQQFFLNLHIIDKFICYSIRSDILAYWAPGIAVRGNNKNVTRPQQEIWSGH